MKLIKEQIIQMKNYNFVSSNCPVPKKSPETMKIASLIKKDLIKVGMLIFHKHFLDMIIWEIKKQSHFMVKVL